ncbi:hypothetical protein PAHAL_3G145600 [Panicum hallii]|uniref:Uncharacterized protein n=1 Tax=Panicum hallii TaxID=206008 RepID=A0A2S3H8R6_9POAL|nr:uncharacterized protein LOC112886215 [Panicum hallii]PAN17635.1 hypothetical protein PAHAL_3G145600 [Panicum hallii]
MAPPPDQDSGSGATPEAAAMLRRQMSACACARKEPVARHDRRLSASTSTSFSSPAASPTLSTSSSSTNYLPASNKLSSESIPFVVPEFGELSSISSTSSYESFFHIEASDPGAEFLDFEPTTRAPAVQTMMAQHQRPEGGAAAYDPKRLPSSMFRTRSTASPGDWSVTSNESLFSIQLSHSSGDLGAMYADLYYDAAGFPSFPTGREAPLRLPSLSESSSVRSGGLCVRHDCARCTDAGGKTRKSVRFATTESVSTGKHSVVTLEVAMEEEKAPASETNAPAAGWCELGCCLPSAAPSWWPRCCLCCGCGCQCKWWL